MTVRKVPSQAASGAETFSDFLVGNQFTSGSNQMTNGTFTIERTIPEKDSKDFSTSSFSDFVTLDDINQEVTTISDTSEKSSGQGIKFNNDKNNGSRSLFGSLKSRVGVSVSDIIARYPAAMMVESSIQGTTNLTAESIVYDTQALTTEFKVLKSLLYNPLEIVIVKPSTSVVSSTEVNIRNFYSSFQKYVIEISGVTYDIVSYTTPGLDNKITLKVNGNCFNGSTGYTSSYLIRPNDGVVEEFYKGLDDLQSVLLNRESKPIFTAGFDVTKDTEDGFGTETTTEYITWPRSRDNWNIQILGVEFGSYTAKLSLIAEHIDSYKSNLIIRYLVAPQLFEFDTEDKKIESIFQIYGQSFDKIKNFIDNVAYMRNVSYDGINNVPDLLLKNLAETLGLSSINLFDEKSLQDSLYTRHNTQYSGISKGLNLVEAEAEFYRRLLVNLSYLYKSKGTRSAIQFFLKFIGAPDPMIRIDEYVYRVDNLLPSKDVEGDIYDAIQGNRIVNVVEYTGTTEFTGYTLTQISGSTSLNRNEYPVDESTGLPRKVTDATGNLFFQKGAGWYKKTLDHRSPDIIDTENSVLTGRTKTIKTKSKPFTYGEDYFNLYRTLPGLDYGYDLSPQIDNTKSEVVTSEESSRLILNRKNLTIFVSADRGIDYDIYRKSRDLSLTFEGLTPQTGVTFAQFLDNVLSEVVTNSNTVKYKNSYDSLLQVYNRYQQSGQFIPYTYVSVTEFVNRLSPYWVNIIEQFIPATSLWTGGNVIENGVFNRSKFKYRRPALPMSYTEILYPDFQTVIREDLETILGGGTMNGIEYADTNFRGLQLFIGVKFRVYVNINNVIYTGETSSFKPFSGYTKDPLDCTVVSSSTAYVPVFCNYGLFNGGDSITTIKNTWKTVLNNLITSINSQNNSETGFTVNVEYYTDIDGVDKVKFIVIPHDYYSHTGNEIVDYYFLPLYTSNRQNSTLTITPSGNTTDMSFIVSNAHGYPSNVNGPVKVLSGSTHSTLSPVSLTKIQNCIYDIPLSDLGSSGILVFHDAGNSEVGFTYNGISFTNTQVLNKGIKKGSVVYKINGSPTLNTYTDLITAVAGGFVVETLVENIQINDKLLSGVLNTCGQLSAGQFTSGNYQFAFQYTGVTVNDIKWLSSSKTNIINNSFEVLPTCKVLVYSNIDTNLDEVPYRFISKYPEDIFVQPLDGSRQGDFLVNQYGYPIEVTGLTLDYCRNDVYYHFTTVENPTSSIISIFNGTSGLNSGLLISYIESIIFPSPSPTPTKSMAPTPTRSITPTPSVTPSITITPSITPSISITPTPSISPGLSLTPTPSVTSSPSITPTTTTSVTPSNTTTPSITPSITITPSPSFVEMSISNNTTVFGNMSIFDVTVNSTSVTPDPGFPFDSSESGYVALSYTEGTYDIVVNLSGTNMNACNINVMDSNGVYYCQNVDGPGGFSFNDIPMRPGTWVSVFLNDGTCT